MLIITNHVRSDLGQYIVEENCEEKDDLDEFSKKLIRLQKERRDSKIKKTIFVTARIHPGETCSSIMMHGFLKYIASATPSAEAMRNHIIFKVIPMINVDGVIVGNYRSGLSGQDLNRKFGNPDPRLHPEVHAIKKLLKEYEQGEILAYIDMHSHSKKKCVFLYGPYYPLHSISYYQVRVFAKLMAQHTPMFRYRACKYRQEPEKLTAARLVISREFGIMNSLTLEASFHGFISEGEKRQVTIEFSKEMYERMGEYCAITIEDYLKFLKEEHLQKLARIITRKMKKANQNVIKKIESPAKIISRSTVLEKIVLSKKPAPEVQKPIMEKKDSKERPKVLKRIKKSKKLCEIYKSIKNDIEKQDNPGSDNESDSNSSSNEEDTQRKEEEEETIQNILSALQTRTPKEYSSVNCKESLVAVGNKIAPKRRNLKTHLDTEYPYKLKKERFESLPKIGIDSDRLKNICMAEKELKKIHRLYQEISQTSPKNIPGRPPCPISQRYNENLKLSNSKSKSKYNALIQKSKELGIKKSISRGIDHNYTSHFLPELKESEGLSFRSHERRKNIRSKFPNYLKFIPSIQEKNEEECSLHINRSFAPQSIQIKLNDCELAGFPRTRNISPERSKIFRTMATGNTGRSKAQNSSEIIYKHISAYRNNIQSLQQQ